MYVNSNIRHNLSEFIIRNEKQFIATSNGIDKNICNFTERSKMNVVKELLA